MTKSCPMISDSNGIMPCNTLRCAWWDEEIEKCAVALISNKLNVITGEENYGLDDVCSTIKECK